MSCFIHILREHATRFYAVVVAVLALVTHYVPDLPDALILGVVAAGLGLGESVQRVENQQKHPSGD